MCTLGWTHQPKRLCFYTNKENAVGHVLQASSSVQNHSQIEYSDLLKVLEEDPEESNAFGSEPDLGEVDRHCEWLRNTMCGNTTGPEQLDERCNSWSFHQKVCLLIKSTVTQDLIENCNSNICSYTLYADNIIQRFKNDSFWVFLNVFYFRGAYPPDGG